VKNIKSTSPAHQSSLMIVQMAMMGWSGSDIKPGQTAEWTMKYGLNYAWLDLLNVTLNLQLD